MTGDSYDGDICPQEYEPRQLLAVKNPNLHKTFAYYLKKNYPGFLVLVKLLQKPGLVYFPQFYAHTICNGHVIGNRPKNSCLFTSLAKSTH